MDCQFSTSTPEKIGNTFSQKSTIYLEPRFRLYDPVEIAESEFISEKELDTKPYLVNKGKFDVEFYFNKSYASSYQISKPSDKKSIDTNELNTSSTIEKVDEIILILNSNSVSSSNTKEQYINNYVYHEEGKNSFYANFYANYGKQTHGKINGEAYLKAIEYFDDNNKPMPTVQVIAIEKQERRIQVAKTNIVTRVVDKTGLPVPAVLANNKGCLGMFSKSQPVVNTSIGPDGKAISEGASFNTREEGNRSYTSKVSVNYEQGKASQVSFDWKQAAAFQMGNYKIEIYNNGFKIGEGVTSLKKGGLF